jgi:hypothetical protein
MAFNGSGTFVRVHDWETDKANSVKITASRMDAEFDGIATGLSNCMTRDGQSPATANIPMGNYLITGLGTANSGDDAMSRDASDARYLRLSGGTVTGDVTASGTWTFATGGTIELDDSIASAGAGNMPLAFDNDPDTGMFQPTGDTIAFASNATEIMRLTAAQNVAIGSTSEPKGRLAVARSLTGSIATSGNTDGSQLAAFYGSNVGTNGVGIHIGTNSDGVGWVQCRDQGSFSANYALSLNPNGGAVKAGGQIQSDGANTAAEPGYSFADDIDTGFYLSADGQTGWASGGAQKALFMDGQFQVRSATSAAPISLYLERQDAHGAAAAVGYARFYGRDDGGNATEYCRFQATAKTVTNGAEDGQLYFSTVKAGSFSTTFYAGLGLVVGSPTGGDKGVGTVNATAVYDDNTLLTCYVFEAERNGGTLDVAAWDELAPDAIVTDEAGEVVARQPKQHFGARKFAERLADANATPLKLKNYIRHWKEKSHLTSLPNRANWDKNKPLSTGELGQRLWETVEIQAVHDAELLGLIEAQRSEIDVLKNDVALLRAALAGLANEATREG